MERRLAAILAADVVGYSRFIREDEGLEMVEWAIVAALITTAAAVTMSLIGTAVDAQFQTILGNITP